jgi:hypothetical protein
MVDVTNYLARALIATYGLEVVAFAGTPASIVPVRIFITQRVT